MAKFLPILLGTDLNAYGMARSFHEEYGINSIAVGEFPLSVTQNSTILQVKIFKNFKKDSEFLAALEEIYNDNKQKFSKFLLIACGDVYSKLLIRNKKKLEQKFIVPCIDVELAKKLIKKEEFYKTCAAYNLDFPKTFILTKENKNNFELPFKLPIVLKPSNSTEWLNCDFENKKKAFIINEEVNFYEIIKKIYNSSYKDNMIVQEFIPGNDSNVRVLNCYVSKEHKVKLMCLGKPLLEDKSPGTIGNYLAIINDYNEEICLKVKEFLEKINYTGFANFDMKYDDRDGKFKLFEINLRQGRSSYFVTGSGYNLAKYIVEDRIFENELEFCIAKNEYIWLGVPLGLLFKNIEKEYKKYVKHLLIENKFCTTLFYKADLTFKKIVSNIKFYLSYYKTFSKHSKIKKNH